MLSLVFFHILDKIVCYIMSIEVLPESFIEHVSETWMGDFGNSYKMGAVARRRVNGHRTSTNNNSV